MRVTKDCSVALLLPFLVVTFFTHPIFAATLQNHSQNTIVPDGPIYAPDGSIVPDSPIVNPTTMPDVSNLAEAAGRYIAAVEQLNVLKNTRCGYALKRRIPSYEKVVADEILPAFPSQARNEAATAFEGLKQNATRQGQTFFDQLFTYYTQTEQQDNNTACGFITGAFITTRKLTAEAFERAKHQRP